MGEPSETGPHVSGSIDPEQTNGGLNGGSLPGRVEETSAGSGTRGGQSGSNTITYASASKPESDKAAGKRPAKPAAPKAGPGTGDASAGDGKLSAKEMKLKKQAEKQARRAQEKAAVGATPGPTQVAQQSGPRTARSAAPTDNSSRPTSAQVAQVQAQSQGQHRRTGSQSQAQRPLALRRRGSQTATKAAPKPAKEVGLFGHLYGTPRRTNLEGVGKEVHPAVIALGFQLSNYTICGSNARCVAMLLAFRAAISSYTTPPTTSLARHLTSHYLSPQIEYLISHRPISVSMGNAIRWLKDYIIHIDPDTPEMVAKSDICEAIDTFIRERITVADTAIANSAKNKIRNGTKVVTYAKSSIVEQTLLAAHDEGKTFSVTVLDSRPLFEGRNLVKRLVAAGMEASYALLPAASHVLRDADIVLLGAHAMMANGRLYSRVGTACVAMIAKGLDVPVIVLAESLKFTDRVALDSIVLNEVAPPEELIIPPPEGAVKPDAAAAEKDTKEKGKKGKKDEPEEKKEESGLQGWRDKQGLQLLNILYDITPAEYVDMVITEYGSLPPSSVPVVFRISTEKDVRV